MTIPALDVPAPPKPGINLGAVVISIIVLVAFATVCVLLFTQDIPKESQTLASIILGSLSTMAGTIVAYWTGSSAGSSAKDATIKELAKP